MQTVGQSNIKIYISCNFANTYKRIIFPWIHFLKSMHTILGLYQAWHCLKFRLFECSES